MWEKNELKDPKFVTQPWKSSINWDFIHNLSILGPFLSSKENEELREQPQPRKLLKRKDIQVFNFISIQEM